MPAADRSLEHIISAERIAGVDLKAIKAFGVDIAGALQYLHDNRKGRGLVHGDFKPRNIVRIHGDWKLIDFDASVQVAITSCTNH
jgi:serine/threonine protein kinase